VLTSAVETDKALPGRVALTLESTKSLLDIDDDSVLGAFDITKELVVGGDICLMSVLDVVVICDVVNANVNQKLVEALATGVSMRPSVSDRAMVGVVGPVRGAPTLELLVDAAAAAAAYADDDADVGALEIVAVVEELVAKEDD